MKSHDAAGILRARAELLARRPEQAETGPTCELLVVAVDGRRLGVEVQRVQQVMPNPGLCRLTAGSGELLGLVPARDGVVPVGDLASVLGGASDSDRPFVVLLEGSAPLGLLVDVIEDVVTIQQRDVLPRQDGGAASAAERAITRQGVVVLDADVLLFHPRLTTHPDHHPASVGSRPQQETHATHDDR